MKNLKKIKGDASFRKFYRKKNKKNNSIIVFTKKEKIKNLIIYEAINRILNKNKILLYLLVFSFGLISSFSLPPYNLFYINFFSYPALLWTLLLYSKDKIVSFNISNPSATFNPGWIIVEIPSINCCPP